MDSRSTANVKESNLDIQAILQHVQAVKSSAKADQKEGKKMRNSNPTQAQDVLEYMEKHGSISIREAIYDLGITRLASRIWELKRKGVQIVSESKQVKARNGRVTNVSVYRLA